MLLFLYFLKTWTRVPFCYKFNNVTGLCTLWNNQYVPVNFLTIGLDVRKIGRRCCTIHVTQSIIVYKNTKVLDHSAYEHVSGSNTSDCSEHRNRSHLRSLLSGNSLFCFLWCYYDNLFLLCCLLIPLGLHLGQIICQFLVLLLSLLLTSLAARFDHQLGTDLQWSFFYIFTSCWNVKRKRLL